jgi:hypothetical protein
MSFATLIDHLNEIKKRNIVSDYAIGGGVAAYEYTGLPTKDVDVFITVRYKSKNIIDLSPIWQYLNEQGYKSWSGQWIIVEDFMLEFLPTTNELEEEAIKNANDRFYEGAKVKLIRPEYLIAIFLKAGRPKDKFRAATIYKTVKLDHKSLNRIIDKYNLWLKLEKVIHAY